MPRFLGHRGLSSVKTGVFTTFRGEFGEFEFRWRSLRDDALVNHVYRWKSIYKQSEMGTHRATPS